MADAAPTEATEALLATTAEQGFLSPGTIAAVLNLEERLLIHLVDRLGGEVHIPNLVEEMTHSPGVELEAEFDGDGTYTLRTVPQ